MKDAQDKVIYVGKATSLRKRVLSYFRQTGKDPKTKLLMQEVQHIDILLTYSEAEALILEASKIKEFQEEIDSALLLLSGRAAARVLPLEQINHQIQTVLIVILSASAAQKLKKAVKSILRQRLLGRAEVSVKNIYFL